MVEVNGYHYAATPVVMQLSERRENDRGEIEEVVVHRVCPEPYEIQRLRTEFAARDERDYRQYRGEKDLTTIEVLHERALRRERARQERPAWEEEQERIRLEACARLLEHWPTT